MNNWEAIWEKRVDSVEIKDDIFETFINLKKADGFDIQCQEGYYEGFYNQFKKMLDQMSILGCDPSMINSVYEVGCGSGVNLYLFKHLCGVKKLGGLDYSKNLISIAKTVVDSDDLDCSEAINVIEEEKYELVISDSVFQYFQDEEYGYEVLEKMFNKATKAIVVREIHDKSMEEEHIRLRRESIDNYDEKYKGLDKTFYDMNKFIEFAELKGCKYKVIHPDNDIYWNNKFVFDFYLIKNIES